MLSWPFQFAAPNRALMEDPTATEFQAALRRLGWQVSEHPNRGGWNLWAQRHGARFDCSGADRDQLWRDALQHAVKWDGV